MAGDGWGRLGTAGDGWGYRGRRGTCRGCDYTAHVKPANTPTKHTKYFRIHGHNMCRAHGPWSKDIITRALHALL
eukprot:1723216-Prymnesium_polylepis.1